MIDLDNPTECMELAAAPPAGVVSDQRKAPGEHLRSATPNGELRELFDAFLASVPDPAADPDRRRRALDIIIGEGEVVELPNGRSVTGDGGDQAALGEGLTELPYQ